MGTAYCRASSLEETAGLFRLSRALLRLRRFTAVEHLVEVASVEVDFERFREDLDLIEEEMEKHPGIVSNPPANFYI